MKYKGFLFTLDAVFALIIAGVSISILIYFNFIPLTTYQFSSSQVYNLMQNLIGTQIKNISQSVLFANYAIATYSAKSNQWQYFGANSNLTSNSSYGPQNPDLLFTYKTPSNIISSVVANNGKIAFETSNQIFVLNSSTGSNYLNITTNSLINGNASVLLYKDSLIYMTSNTINSINLINKQGSVINQNIAINQQIVASVPITLTNSQLSSTPLPFQQIININPSLYEAYESGNLDNIEFFYANGTIIPSWLESGNSNTSTSTYYWLKLNNGIPASSSITIYMGIAPIGTNIFNGNTIGEAPQLSSTYAEYDNGANIFNNYFSGNSLTGWTVSGTAGQSSAPAGNPIFGTPAFYANGAVGDYLYTIANSQNINMIIEYYAYTPNLDDLYFLANSIGAGQMMRVGNGTAWYGIASTSSWTSWSAPPDNLGFANEWGTVKVTVVNGVATGHLAVNAIPYGSNINENPSNQYTVANNGDYLGLIGDGANSLTTSYWNGVIIRAYPPNGIMPSQTTGPIIQLPTSSLAPASDAPISIEDGYIAEGTISGFYLLNLSNFGIYTSILTSISGIPNIMIPAYANGEFIITSSSGFTNQIMSYSLNGKTLTQTWNSILTSSPTTSPSIYNNVIYVGSGDNLYAFTLGGNLIFNILLSSQIKGISILNNEVFVQCQNNIYGINAKTGAILFSYLTKSSLSSAISGIVPSSTPNILYLIANQSEFQAYNIKTDSLIWNITLPSSSYKNFTNIALAYGSAYIASGNTIYGFRTCSTNPNNNLLKLITEMYLNYSGACADILFNKAYNSSNAGIFINNTYAPSLHVASFNGKGYINETKPIPFLANSLQNFTFSIWANPFNQSGIIVQSQNLSKSWAAPYISIVSNTAYVAIVQPGGAMECLSLGNIPLNQWTNIAMTYENVSGSGNYLTGYINGKQIAQVTTTGRIQPVTYFILGANTYTGAEANCGTTANYTGQMSDFQIYNASLTAYQVLQLYDEGISGIPVSSNINLWYPLQGNANDYSGNNLGFGFNIIYSKTNYIPNSYKNAYQINKLLIPLNLNVNNTSKLYNVSVAIWH